MLRNLFTQFHTAAAVEDELTPMNTIKSKGVHILGPACPVVLVSYYLHSVLEIGNSHINKSIPTPFVSLYVLIPPILPGVLVYI